MADYAPMTDPKPVSHKQQNLEPPNFIIRMEKSPPMKKSRNLIYGKAEHSTLSQRNSRLEEGQK